ncbi:MAG: hypothetical protein ACRYG2_37845 [Janthinobacterium lividum]
MAADDSRTDVLLASWAATPAFARDRYLTIRAANFLAHALSPAFQPGVNLLRHVFLTDEPAPSAQSDARSLLMAILVALLRDSLQEHEEDEVFVDLVGELAACSHEFAALWSRSDLPLRHHATVLFPDTRVGELRMTYQELRMPLESGEVIVVWRPADARSAAACDRLLSR